MELRVALPKVQHFLRIQQPCQRQVSNIVQAMNGLRVAILSNRTGDKVEPDGGGSQVCIPFASCERPATTALPLIITHGWNIDHMARAWDELMRGPKYKRCVSQGGDWGVEVSDVMAPQAPAGPLGIHMPAAVLSKAAKILNYRTKGDLPMNPICRELNDLRKLTVSRR